LLDSLGIDDKMRRTPDIGKQVLSTFVPNSTVQNIAEIKKQMLQE